MYCQINWDLATGDITKASLVKGRGTACGGGIVILNEVKNLCFCANTNSFYAALALLLVAKVTKTAGVAIRPHPNAAQVWNATSATNHGNLKPHSLCSLARQISS